jgi:hypothetical protein
LPQTTTESQLSSKLIEYDPNIASLNRISYFITVRGE